MSGFFRNIRGLNKTTKHTVIRDWIEKSPLQFGCILETRVTESKADRVAYSVFRDWSRLSNYEHSRLGTIWVVWNPRVRVTPCYKSDQLNTWKVRKRRSYAPLYRLPTEWKTGELYGRI